MSKVALVETLQLRSNSVVVYKKKVSYAPVRQLANLNLKSNFKEAKTYSGNVTFHAQKRIRTAVQILNQTSSWKKVLNPTSNQMIDYRLVFITLTLSSPVKVDDRDAYKYCLKPMLRWMKDKLGVNSYIWKAELQQRGQIHYHLTCNQFVYWKTIRDQWNKLQKKAGYLDEFQKKYGHYNANSTDVHKVRNDGDIACYMEKYIAKAGKGGKVLGKVWDCSVNLKGKRLFETQFTPAHKRNILSIAEDEFKDIIYNAYFDVIKFKKDIGAYKILDGYEHQLYDEWKKTVILDTKKKLCPPQSHASAALSAKKDTFRKILSKSRSLAGRMFDSSTPVVPASQRRLI